MPGHNPAGVSAHPIRLTIAGRDLPTLTIVDLPGMSQTTHWAFDVHKFVKLHHCVLAEFLRRSDHGLLPA